MDDRSAQDERIMTLVAAALSLNAEQRESYLRAECGSDQPLFEETVEAIEWEERMGAFLRQPMVPRNNPDQPFEPGEIISQRFEIIRRIGEGGMGIVYEAFDKKRNQRIALKCAKPGFGSLLTPELDSALKVRHPNVCLVNEVHTSRTSSAEIDFLTMELLDGEPLSALLSRNGKLPPDEAQEIARQLCAGLAEAHRSNVIHRDLKAGNIIICRQAGSNPTLRAVITDFGLAGEAAKSGFFGTQRYMAPELLLGQKASKASDIFALGVIFYEMGVGNKAEDIASTPTVSRDYQRVTADFINIQPERRTRAFQTAVETLSRPTYGRRQWITVGIGAALALGGATWRGRETIADVFHPLPQKRFVALMPWPSSQNQQTKSVISSAIDAVESELSRAESSDHNLLIISAPKATQASLVNLSQSYGLNLALQVSGSLLPDGFLLLLKLVDISNGATLRQHQIVCHRDENASLELKAVQSAASLLDVYWNPDGAERVKHATGSEVALQAFLDAQEFRKRANDDGLQSAIDSFKKAIDVDPQYAAAYANLAMTYCRLNAINPGAGVLPLARANAETALQLDHGSATAHTALAFFFSAKGDVGQALNHIGAAASLDPTDPENLSSQGQIYNHFNRWKEAEQAFRQLQKQRPNYYVGYNDLGVVLGNVGRYAEAIESFKAAIAAAPHSTLVLNNLGLFNLKLGDTQLAEQIYRRSLTIKPTASAYFNLAEVLRVQGKLAEAVSSCKQALSMTPDDDQVWFALANCYEAAEGHERDARAAFQKAATLARTQLDTEPNDGSTWMRLALYRLKDPLVHDALPFIQRAEACGPLAIDSEILKVRILELAGKRNEALETVAHCFQQGPVGFELESIKDLRPLVKDPRYLRIPKSTFPSNRTTLSPKGAL